LTVTLTRIAPLAQDISSFELIAIDGGGLPPFTAGAHIDVHLPNGMIRQYSLCSDPADTTRYVVAVLRDTQGRGGSVAMHDELLPGSNIKISRPRNHFPLVRNAHKHHLVAGGIGITPMISMIAALQARNESFHLYYCTRSKERAAFLETLQPLVAAGLASIHYDDAQGCGLNLAAAFKTPQQGAHVYYCGPNGFMSAMQQATEHWPAGTVHFERFGAPDATENDADALPQEEFTVQLARSGGTYVVKPGETIVEVVTRHGVEIDVSCEEGYCGTCMTRYLAGQPEHHDTVLDDDDRETFVMVCCARARGEPLVLDL
jgi:vanillate O-demethylase ferredoxin subunit